MQSGYASEQRGTARSDASARPSWRAVVDERSIGLLLLVFLGAIATARLSLLTIVEPQNVPGIWLPAGVIVAALLLAERARWPFILAGAAAGMTAAYLLADIAVGPTAGFVTASLIGPVVAVLGLRRFGFETLDTVRNVLLFMAMAVIAGPIVGGLIGAAAATLATGAPFGQAFGTWTFAEAAGALVVVPPALVFAVAPLRRPRTTARLAEATGLGGLLLGLCIAAFGPWDLFVHPAAYPLFLFLVLAAVRFGLPGAALSTLVVAVTSVIGTLAGHGPVAQLNPGSGVQVAMAVILVAASFLTAFVTAAAIAERHVAEEALEVRMAAEARRAALGERLTAFAREIARSLELEAFFQQVVREAIVVVPADIVWISIALTDGGPHRVVTAIGAPDLIGHVIEPGDGVIGIVIRDGTTVVRDRIEPDERSTNRRTALPDRPMAVACAPIVIDGNVAGTLGLCRLALDTPFDAPERRSLELMAGLVAVSLTNTVEFSEVLDRSIQDELTGVPNRRYFTAAFEQLAAQRARQAADAREPVSAIMFDLDHFGAVNKERGHGTGDRVLAEFGHVLTTRLRRADVVARYGGEEFVAILVGTPREEAARVAEEIRVGFGELTITGADGDPIRCTVSAGVAGVGSDEASLEGLLPAADVALAMAKRAGRNMVATA